MRGPPLFLAVEFSAADVHQLPGHSVHLPVGDDQVLSLFQMGDDIVHPGGGINTVEDFDRVLKCGADKVSVNSGAIRNPQLVHDAARLYGDQCVVLSADVKRVDGQFRVFAKGGREDTGMEAIGWIKKCVDNGAGEVVLNSIDTDGVKGGFDLPMLEAVSNAVDVPVIASGGAGCAEDFVTLFESLPKVDAGLAASIFHFGQVKIPELKQLLNENNIPVRL